MLPRESARAKKSERCFRSLQTNRERQRAKENKRIQEEAGDDEKTENIYKKKKTKTHNN